MRVYCLQLGGRQVSVYKPPSLIRLLKLILPACLLTHVPNTTRFSIPITTDYFVADGRSRCTAYLVEIYKSEWRDHNLRLQDASQCCPPRCTIGRSFVPDIDALANIRDLVSHSALSSSGLACQIDRPCADTMQRSAQLIVADVASRILLEDNEARPYFGRNDIFQTLF